MMRSFGRVPQRAAGNATPRVSPASGWRSGPMMQRLLWQASAVPTTTVVATAGQQRGFSSKAVELDMAKRSKNKSTARGTPRFQTIRTLLQTMMLMFACGGATWGIRRLYYSYRTEGNTVAIAIRLQDEIRIRPHWASALVAALLHHVLTDQGTPFGSPLVVPAATEPEVREVLKLLRELQLEHPGTSLPDLWAAAVTYSIASLGGPLVPIVWGRLEEEFPPEPVVVTDAKVTSLTSDSRLLKRVMSTRSSLATEELVALLGSRTVGTHGGKYGRAQVDFMAESAAEMLETRRYVAKELPLSDETPGVSSSSPGVFDNDMFVCIARSGWTPVVKKKSQGGFFGLGGGSAKDAPTPPEPSAQESDPAALEVYQSPEVPQVYLQPLDMAVKNDMTLLPWAQKFAENEVRFFNMYQKAAERVMRMGWEGWTLTE